MNTIRANSSPQLVEKCYNDSTLEGVATNVKLLLKLIEDHKVSCYKEKNDGRLMLRVATMMTILDNVRSRIQKCQTFRKKRLGEEFRREGSQEQIESDDDDEKEKLRKDLNASLIAQKNLEIMCSSLGREKEIIAAELAMKVHQLNETDELINDLKNQNQTLLKKLHDPTSDDNVEKRSMNNAVETQENISLQNRNESLSTQLLHSLDGYQSMKNKYKEAQDENSVMCATMKEIETKVKTSLDQIHDVKECLGSRCDVQDQISDLEHVFESLELQVEGHEHNEGECLTPSKENIFNRHPQTV